MDELKIVEDSCSLRRILEEEGHGLRHSCIEEG